MFVENVEGRGPCAVRMALRGGDPRAPLSRQSASSPCVSGKRVEPPGRWGDGR